MSQLLGRMPWPGRQEVRYDRAFLLDLRGMETSAFKRVQKFVFEEFFQVRELQTLAEFQPLNSSEILYRFTLENHLICIEVTGQIIKFLRIVPRPNL
jgi:hypothetical protein